MIARATVTLGDAFAVLPQISMICLDLETSLTNHSDHGVDKTKGISPIRSDYREAWSSWIKEHNDSDSIFLALVQEKRRYAAANEMIVDNRDILSNLKDTINAN
ncbi:MAG: hypothetical protein P3W90_005475 [Paracoccus sp. (in: a-proteobacteria)]|nr:hypothetical protein [Paracoccus sp. (in: a-proteobacteria)]